MSPILAIIPARKGSKRIPHKNTIDFCGKPLIAHTIECAKACNDITDIIVSSDDDSILNIAAQYNVGTHRRSKNLSTDEAKTADLVKEIAIALPTYNILILLQPTSPLRQPFHISEALKLMRSRKCSELVSLTPIPYDPSWLKVLTLDSGVFKLPLPENPETSIQQSIYRLNGAIYICSRTNALNSNNLFHSDDTCGFVMDELYSVDIDTYDDLQSAMINFEKINPGASARQIKK